jgi:hypothetical protein
MRAPMGARDVWAAATCSEGANGPVGVAAMPRRGEPAPRLKARFLQRGAAVVTRDREPSRASNRTVSFAPVLGEGRYQGFTAIGTGTNDRADGRRRRASRWRLLVAATVLAPQITPLGGRTAVAILPLGAGSGRCRS